MDNYKESWGIIGGGIMGMTLAMRLAQRGFDVTLFEASGKVGGLAGTIDRAGVTYDKFYHVILMSDISTRKVIREIGLENDLRWVETKTGFFSGGKLYSMSNIIEFLKFPPLSLLDKLQLGLTIVLASFIKDWHRMEGIPVEKWLKRWSGRNVFEKIWLPLLKAKLGDHYKDTSALFIWATIQRMYAARRTGLKKEMFGYIKGGYNVINDAFEQKLAKLGVKLILNSKINLLNRAESGRITIESFGSGEFEFDNVISTLPSDLSVQIAPLLKSEEIQQHKSIKYLGVICPSILLTRSISKFYVTNIIDDWPIFTGIIESTALIDPAEIGNMNLIYLPKYVDPSSNLFDMSDVELQKYFLGSLLRMYPDLLESEIIQWNFASARRVFALPVIDFSGILPSVVTSLKGYYIINSAQIINGILNINETVQVAESKLEEILSLR